jgi:hypothetical protein
MSPPFVPPVEALRIRPVQPLHRRLERIRRDVEQEVVVRRQQREREAADPPPADGGREPVAEVGAIVIVTEERDLAGRPRVDVIDPGVNLASRSPCHRGNMRGALERDKPNLRSRRDLVTKL